MTLCLLQDEVLQLPGRQSKKDKMTFHQPGVLPSLVPGLLQPQVHDYEGWVTEGNDRQTLKIKYY